MSVEQHDISQGQIRTLIMLDVISIQNKKYPFLTYMNRCICPFFQLAAKVVAYFRACYLVPSGSSWKESLNLSSSSYFKA